MGLTALGEAPPRALEDVAQHAFLEMPTNCGRCRGPNLILEHEIGTEGPPRRVHCFTCGWDSFFVMSSRGRIPVLSVPVETGGVRRTTEVMDRQDLDIRTPKRRSKRRIWT